MSTSSSIDSLSRHRDSAPPPRRSHAWLLPIGILLGFALLFLILFRDRLLPATQVESAQVIAIPSDQETTTPAPKRGDETWRFSNIKQLDFSGFSRSAGVSPAADLIARSTGQDTSQKHRCAH